MASNANKSDSKTETKAPDPDPKPQAKDLESEVETGGLSGFREPDHVIAGVIEKVEDAIKTEINALKKNDPPLGKADKLTVVGYRVNIVNGYMYFAKVKIHGDSFVQAKILQTPKGVATLQSITETKTDADERDYFKLPASRK